MVEYLAAGAILGYAYLKVKSESYESKEVQALNKIFKECKIKNSSDQVATVSEYIKYDTFTEFYIDIPIGKSVADLEKCINPIETYFKNNASIEYKKNDVCIKLYTKHLKDYYAYKLHKVDKSKGLNVILGMSRDGVIERNLNTEPHLSVVGSTGSGKSVYVNNMLCQLIENYTSDELELVLLDLKINPIETYFKNNASIEYKKNDVCIKLYTKHLKDYYAYKLHKVDKSKGLNVILGMSRDGVIERNLNTEPHLSVVGSTGSGKSVYVNNMLCQLIENYTSDELELVLLDLKGNELNEYRDLEHTKFHTIEIDTAIGYFHTLRAEMHQRYQKLGNHRNIQSYNKANPHQQMKYMFVVVEECYSLINKQGAWDVLGDILSKARACGIHILLTTQRPTADVIPARVTTHLGIRVGLKTNKAQESKNAIETVGLEKLTVPGSGIINFSGKYEYFQGFHITDQQIEKIIAKYRKRMLLIN